MQVTDFLWGAPRSRGIVTGTLALVLLSPVSAVHANTSTPVMDPVTTTSLCDLCTSVTVTGKVSAYVKATATSHGYITIGGVKHLIKAGVNLPVAVKVGATVKLTLTLDLLGRITACTVNSVKVTVTGKVSAYVKATATSHGYITIGGVKHVIKAGVNLPAEVKVGAWVRLRLTLDGAGRITACTVNSVKVTVTGKVTAFVPATLLTSGSLVIGGKAYVIATGTIISTHIQVGLNVTLQLTLNSSGHVTSCKAV